MSKSFYKDLTGQRFGRLTVLEFVPDDRAGSYWRCKCDCGNKKIVRRNDLLSGHTASCGCQIGNHSHGLTGTRLYNIWGHMKRRCYNSNDKDYNHYGGRGISICKEWMDDFKAFYDWAMANGYRDDLSIDRIDVNGNYCPINCRWATKKEQQNNQRSNVYVEYEGKLMRLSDAAIASGINYHTLISRYRKQYRGERLFRPKQKQNHSK